MTITEASHETERLLQRIEAAWGSARPSEGHESAVKARPARLGSLSILREDA